MSKIIECIKCFCGCNEISKERLKELLSMKIHSLLNDEIAVEMLKKFIPIDSNTHKYIAIISKARALIKADMIDKSSDEWESFVDDLEEFLADELNKIIYDQNEVKEMKDTNKFLEEQVIFEYSKKIETSKDYENFKKNLIKKYNTRFTQT